MTIQEGHEYYDCQSCVFGSTSLAKAVAHEQEYPEHTVMGAEL